MTSYLMEGELCSLFDRRRDMVERMAACLVEHRVPLNSDATAREFLCEQGFRPIDVGIMGGDARIMAQQIVVGREMSQDRYG